MTSALRDLESALCKGPLSSADLKPQLLRLSASVRERLCDREFASAALIQRAVRVVSGLKRDVFPALRFDILCEAVPYLYSHGSLSDALVAARGMREASQDDSRMRRAENYLGIVHEALGNIAQAVIHYHAALRLAKDLRDQRGELSVLVNLGAALANGALYREAMPCVQAAYRLAISGAGPVEAHALILGNIALVQARMGDTKAAYATMKRCLALPTTPHRVEDLYALTNREFNFIQIALDIGDLTEAKARFDACRTFASVSSDGMSLNSKLVEGVYSVYTGDVQRGLALLHEVHMQSKSSERVNDRIDALTMLTRAYEQCARPKEALMAMRELLDHICAKRQAAVSALLSLDVSPSRITDQAVDLQALHLREAELRAATAEMEAVDSTFEMLERLAVTASLREDPSGHHGDRVGRLSSLLAGKAGLPKGDCFAIETAAKLHDIGKVAIPDNILLSSEQLREEQRRFLRNHTTMGAELLSKSALPQLRLVEHVARYHHEWWDGSGYPTGIGGERIPLAARIVAVADVFDALTHGRPYADAWPVHRALAEIERLAGTQFDPVLARSFVEMIHELQARYGDVDAFLERSCADSPFSRARRNIARIVSAH